MKAFVAGLLMIAGAAHADETAIQGVIDGQMTAFLAEDVDTAFGYAGPGIRSMFGTPDNFGRMVAQGYPMVWRPANVEFLTTRQTGAGWRQDVLVTDAEGRLHKLAYTMIETADGWKIAGVQVLTAPEVGV
ncbi:DUF4864 domain-containing protein [Jannaschia sp. 2305UL9-9]|uniref:DUF4864 domain-containing protein n=1 Tax=Jannaschia sp. 2305UL9-9 TaxID=3121638 RepID=UPI003529AFE0